MLCPAQNVVGPDGVIVAVGAVNIVVDIVLLVAEQLLAVTTTV